MRMKGGIGSRRGCNGREGVIYADSALILLQSLCSSIDREMIES